jgi:LacI family transcriptional regulator
VREAAERLGYRPNAAARAMVNQRTRNIGVVVWAMGGTPISLHETELVSGVHDVLEPSGYTTCLVQMGDVERTGDGIARVFAEQVLDGMVICCGLKRAMRERLGGLVDKIIWCDAGVREPTNSLWRDDKHAGLLAGQAIARAGYRKAIWLHQKPDPGPQRTYNYQENRLAGVVEGAGADCVIDPMPILPEDEIPWQSFGERLSPQTVVVACSYAHATLAVTMASACGKVAGRDFALACCDELAAWEFQWPNLARSSFDRFAMGRQAALMMLQRLKEPTSGAESWVSRPVWRDGATGTMGNMPPTLPPLA